VKPELIVALGATGARAVMGRAVTIGRLRGQALSLDDGTRLVITIHPSALLRTRDDDERHAAYAGFVKDQTEDPGVRDDVIEIERAAERAAALTRQLLAFGSREAVQPTNLDLNAVLQERAGMLRRAVGDGVTLELRLADDLWQVHADQGQMEQVLMNLALNSRDAMPDGGVLRIETWNVEGPGGRGPRVRVVVRDAGSGMTPEVREHAFDPFFTTKASGEGTGLGLATVYGIVKGAGGEVTIQSDPEQGTQVTVELPAVTSPVAARAADGDGDGKVLLVDDEQASPPPEITA